MSRHQLLHLTRFIISGGTSAAVNLLSLQLLVVAGVWYLYASIVAYLLSFIVSFTLQKFWTFQDHSRDNLHGQALIYLLILLVGVAINTFLVYSFVEYFGFHHLAAQIMAGIIIAFGNYFAYRKFVFRPWTQPI